jgi:hypothetical protein
VAKQGIHVKRQRLFDPERVKAAAVVVDRLTLPASASVQFDVSAKSVASLHMLDGDLRNLGQGIGKMPMVPHIKASPVDNAP